MKVAINRYDSDFGISKKAKDYLISKGMKITKREDKTGNLINRKSEIIDNSGKWKEKFHVDRYILNDDEFFPNIRTDQRLIEMIEKFNYDASGSRSNIKVVEIPDNVEFYIKGRGEYAEYVSEKHRKWF